MLLSGYAGLLLDMEEFYFKHIAFTTLLPIIMVQSKMGVSPIGSLPFKYSHFPLNRHYGRKSNMFLHTSQLVEAKNSEGSTVSLVISSNPRKI